jgi:hypothetical protein
MVGASCALAQDTKKPAVNLNPWALPLVPPGSTVNVLSDRTPGATDQLTGYPPLKSERTTPTIGLSIKTPLDFQK